MARPAAETIVDCARSLLDHGLVGRARNGDVRVFVTGASGFIGSAVVQQLLDADASADSLRAAGVDVHRGDVHDVDSLRAGAADADGVIHLAFGHDFSAYAAAVAADLRAVEAIGEQLAGSDRPLVITSGTLALAFAGGTGTEDMVLDPALPRVGAEHAAIALADRGVRSAVVRLAPCVHDVHRAGLASRLIDIARERGVAAYVGDGTNVWPGVHRLDAADLFVRALERAPAGTRLHGAAEPGVPMRDIVETIGNRLGLPSKSITREEIEDHFGDAALFVTLDNPTSSARTREQLGWDPTLPSLLHDLENAEL
jgi:nucleoside-diphosphate-sugar epimerase